MYVEDLEAMKEFYTTYFSAQANGGYHNGKTGLSTYFLCFEDGARLEIMRRPQMHQQQKRLMQTGYIHLAISVGSRENVIEITERLQAAGYEVVSHPRTTGDGYFESSVLDPEGNQIEITI